MTVVASVLTALTPALPQIVTGVFTVVAGFGGIRLTQRYGERQRERESVKATNAKIEAVVQELIEAVSELRIDLSVHQPTHNAWRPRLLMLGSAVLELVSVRQADGLVVGFARAGRLAVEADEREKTAAVALRLPLQRVMACVARTALLPAGPVRDAALQLAAAASDFAIAHGQDGLWRPRKAAQLRTEADEALLAALGELFDAATAQLHPAAAERRRRWWRRQPSLPGTAAALPASHADQPATASRRQLTR